MEIVGEFLVYDTEKGTWQYFATHHRDMFPNLSCRTSFVRQAANLWAYKRALQQRLARELSADTDDVHLFHREVLAKDGIEIQTPRPKGSRLPFTIPYKWAKKLRGLRRLIETVIGQLSERLHFERVRARDQWHLTSRLWRKLLTHTVAVFFNRKLGQPLLHLDELVSLNP